MQDDREDWEKRFDKEFPIWHYYCEDSWYSCPKAEDGCANEAMGNDCSCDAEEKHEKAKQFIRDLLKSRPAELTEEALEQVIAEEQLKLYNGYRMPAKPYFESPKVLAKAILKKQGRSG